MFWYTYQSKHLCQNVKSLIKSTKKCVWNKGDGGRVVLGHPGIQMPELKGRIFFFFVKE